MVPLGKNENGDETDWEKYAAELSEARGGEDWPISLEPRESEAYRPRAWAPEPADDELPESADDVLDATYEAQGRSQRTTLENVLLAVAGLGLLLIVLSEISVLTLSPTLFIVVVIASAGAAVAWIVSFATGHEDDDGMRV